MAGVRRGGKGKKGAREACEGRRRLQGCYCFLHSTPNTLAKPTQLWNVWMSKLSSQNHAAYLMAKSVGANRFSYFLFLFFAQENEII